MVISLIVWEQSPTLQIRLTQNSLYNVYWAQAHGNLSASVSQVVRLLIGKTMFTLLPTSEGQKVTFLHLPSDVKHSRLACLSMCRVFQLKDIEIPLGLWFCIDAHLS